MLINPSSITSSTMDKASGRVTLFVVARDGVNEQGFSQARSLRLRGESLCAARRAAPMAGWAAGRAPG